MFEVATHVDRTKRMCDGWNCVMNDKFFMAYRSIRARKARSILHVLGIAVDIAAIAVVVSSMGGRC